jgi:alcohol dehydrogenase (cytochrome c)
MMVRGSGVLPAAVGLMVLSAWFESGIGHGAPVTDAGKSAYAASCASCHGPTLAGTLGPALKGDAFRAKWNAKGASALRDFISQSMPPADPGSLSPETYSHITSFIQEANDMTGSATPASSGGSEDKATTPGMESGGMAAAVENRDAKYEEVMARRAAILAAIRPVGEAALRDPPAEDWLSWRRTDDGQAYSPLAQINRANAASLSLAWSLTLPGGTNAITPLVRDGVMFLNSHGTVLAIDVKSSDILWKFVRPATPVLVGPPVTQPRGMAIFEDRLLVPTSDNHMIALDVHTGRIVWDHPVAGTHKLMRFTSNPIVVHGKVIQGMSGCWSIHERGKCFVVALDAGTGAELWRFNTIPQIGEPGSDTWNNAPYEDRAGASVWSTGTYDPENNLVYFGTGQTYHIATLMLPVSKRTRGNAGLYTDSTLALNPDTGALVWHYQHMARDVWDLDWAYERTVATIPVKSKPQKVVMTMGKLGILDVLDAKTGRYVFSYDLGMQNLVTSIDPVTGWKTTDPALEPDPKQAKFMCPFAAGVRNWPATSYDPASHLLYVSTGDQCMNLIWNLGEDFDINYGPKPRPNGDGNTGSVTAINLVTRKSEWSHRYRAPGASATLSTAGGLVFDGGRDRRFRAADGASGEVLWEARLDNIPSAAPITFAKDGIQYVSITTGGGNPNDVIRQSSTPEDDLLPHATTLWVFKLSSQGIADEHAK